MIDSVYGVIVSISSVAAFLSASAAGVAVWLSVRRGRAVRDDDKYVLRTKSGPTMPSKNVEETRTVTDPDDSSDDEPAVR